MWPVAGWEILTMIQGGLTVGYGNWAHWSIRWIQIVISGAYDMRQFTRAVQSYHQSPRDTRVQGTAGWLKQLTPVLSGELQDTQMINSCENGGIQKHQKHQERHWSCKAKKERQNWKEEMAPFFLVILHLHLFGFSLAAKKPNIIFM